VIEASEVQGNVLYAYGDTFPFARYVLLRITDTAGARARLKDWVTQVTFGRRPWDVRARQHETCDQKREHAATVPTGSMVQPHLNIGLTYTGLQTLGIRDELLYAFPREFREGARPRSHGNGDRGPSAASEWIDGLGTGHLILIVHGTTEQGRDRFLDQLLLGASGCMTRLHDRSAALLKPRRLDTTIAGRPTFDPSEVSCALTFDREHFGFADGCSQPAIESIAADPTGDGVYASLRGRWWRPLRWLELLIEELGIRPVDRRWRPIRAGEFLLGYENEDGEFPKGPPAPLGPNGTFMVYRPMQQHVEAFDAFIQEQADRLDLNADLLRAKIVGRWPDGTPLTLSPERPNPIIGASRIRANDFLYEEDRHGYHPDRDGHACPLGAHIRRTNPRDGLPGGGERTMRHRIIRRGMPYGSRDRDEERGLVFVCFSASINDGFEFIQRTWCNSGEAFGLGRERDLLLQQGSAEELTGMVIPGPSNETVVLSAPSRPLVTVRGCEYLFLPSRQACQWLANLP